MDIGRNDTEHIECLTDNLSIFTMVLLGPKVYCENYSNIKTPTCILMRFEIILYCLQERMKRNKKGKCRYKVNNYFIVISVGRYEFINDMDWTTGNNFISKLIFNVIIQLNIFCTSLEEICIKLM